MKFLLRAFQKKAVRGLLDELYSCHEELKRIGKLQVVTLSAIVSRPMYTSSCRPSFGVHRTNTTSGYASPSLEL